MTVAGWVEPENFFVTHAAGRGRAFWLDGGGSRAWSGRTSFVGWLHEDDVSLTWSAYDGVVREHRIGAQTEVGSDVLKELSARQVAGSGGAGGWVGWLGYPGRRDLPAQVATAAAVPDACWMRMDRWVAFDHESQVARPGASDGDPTGAWRREAAALLEETRAAPPVGVPPQINVPVETLGADAYAAAFARVQHALKQGNSYEVNLTYRTTVTSRAHPLDTYRRLRRLNPAPYAAYLAHEGASVLSSSPERYALVDFATAGPYPGTEIRESRYPDRRIETRPIKGTTPRHADPGDDARAARLLQEDPKFRGESLMIVDLLRNDLARVCEVGSVQVTDLMHVETYPSVHQLINTIEGRLRPDVSTYDALAAMFPGGSMTGAPKLRTMQLIADIEATPRGVYSGALGWIGDDGRADLGIVIRTLVHADGRYELGTGGGITVRSRVEDEYAEARWKAENLLRALGASPG